MRTRREAKARQRRGGRGLAGAHSTGHAQQECRNKAQTLRLHAPKGVPGRGSSRVMKKRDGISRPQATMTGTCSHGNMETQRAAPSTSRPKKSRHTAGRGHPRGEQSPQSCQRVNNVTYTYVSTNRRSYHSFRASAGEGCTVPNQSSAPRRACCHPWCTQIAHTSQGGRCPPGSGVMSDPVFVSTARDGCCCRQDHPPTPAVHLSIPPLL